MDKMAVGSDIEAYCTKCKLVLGHTVVTLQGAKARRVKCNTCGGEHNFRATKPVGKAAAKTTAKKTAKAKSAPRKTRQSWEEVMEQAASKPHKPYSMSGKFDEGDWIMHNTFGLGCVQSYTPPNKISVRFADSVRMLICNQP